MAEYFKQDREETTGKNLTVAKAMEMYIDSRENVIEKTTIRNYRQIANSCFKCIMDVKPQKYLSSKKNNYPYRQIATARVKSHHFAYLRYCSKIKQKLVLYRLSAYNKHITF